jgi:hypothetical protein
LARSETETDRDRLEYTQLLHAFAFDGYLFRGSGVGSEIITRSDDQSFGYTEICRALSKRFGTRFELETTGTCATLVADLEGGVRVVITDCVGPLSPVEGHLDGRAAGFFVGLHHAELGTEGGAEVDVVLAYAYSEMAPPTAAAIGDLVQEALERVTATGLGKRTRRRQT